MNIKTYSPTDSGDLARLLRDKYGTHRNFDYFLEDFNTSFNFCVQSENVLFQPIGGYEEEGKLRAHIALIGDKRLPAGEAFFGFLEFPEDVSVFNSLWQALLEEAQKRGISVLKGPVNGSIWHQYRCIKESDGSEFFKAEPIGESYYYDFLVANKPESEITYLSAYRTQFDLVLRLLGAVSYNKLSLEGFSIKEANGVTLEELRTIATISKETFNTSWGYTELTEKEFLQLYPLEKLSAHLTKLYLLYKDQKIIGFLSTAKEDPATLICKTVAIRPEFQGRGLGNALAYKMHIDARKEGFAKIIYALIREGNKVKNFPKESTVIFRKYATFEFHL